MSFSKRQVVKEFLLGVAIVLVNALVLGLLTDFTLSSSAWVEPYPDTHGSVWVNIYLHPVWYFFPSLLLIGIRMAWLFLKKSRQQ